MDSSASPSKKIQLLPEHIIDQIKAGEVIERPSTLLKELLENSIDAQSTEIEIEIVNNGLDLISVKDNGVGIAFEDLDLAFCRHATSKIERFEDIYNLFTYGFRGEALASIASISKLTCVSNPKDRPEGTIKIEGGEVVALDQDKEPSSLRGSGMFIRDLFYNTPARMKFIQSKTSERNHLDKIVKAFLLTQPEVKFTVKWDEQDKKVYPARSAGELKKRVEETIKKNRPLKLMEAASSYDQIDFKVFLSLDSTRGNAGKSQFIFVNNRLVQDVQIHKIILNSAQNLWPRGETGHYCAYIQLPSDRLDVNIHPNKIQVKFYEPAKVFSLVSGSIKEALFKKSKEGSSGDKTRHCSQENNLELPGEGMERGFKKVEYRTYEFDSSNSSLENYFQRLDDSKKESVTRQESEPLQSLAVYRELSLFKIEEKLLLVKTPELMSAWLEKILSEEDASPMPLLVSQPLRLDGAVSPSLLEALPQIGFEVDPLGSNDFVLRTFPQCLKNFPFKEYLEVWLNQAADDSCPKRDFRCVMIRDQREWSRFHRRALESLSLPKALELELALELDEEKIKKLL